MISAFFVFSFSVLSPMAAETVGDYVAGFLGMAEGNAWSMNAFDVCLFVVDQHSN